MHRAVVGALSLLILALAALAVMVFLFRHPVPDPFLQARPEWPPRLPADAGAHFGAMTEWWYYTGLLQAEEGERFGFELAFFKAYAPPHLRLWGRVPLSWFYNPIYMAHLAVTDLGQGTFYHEETTNLPFPWAGGARPERYQVWVRDWWAGADGAQHRLWAEAPSHTLSLALVSQKPPVFHGGDGVVPMGEGGTSYYYSLTRMVGEGWLVVDGERLPVQAAAWMDHQWGSWDWSQFAGWDWFSLRLDGGEDLMLFQFRGEGGAAQPQSFGTYVSGDGTATSLAAEAFRIQVLDRWQSPHTGAIYPSRWKVETRRPAGNFEVQALVPDQEMDVRFGPTYWEGVCRVAGTLAGEPAAGVAYVEMTGYR